MKRKGIKWGAPESPSRDWLRVEEGGQWHFHHGEYLKLPGHVSPPVSTLKYQAVVLGSSPSGCVSFCGAFFLALAVLRFEPGAWGLLFSLGWTWGLSPAPLPGLSLGPVTCSSPWAVVLVLSGYAWDSLSVMIVINCHKSEGALYNVRGALGKINKHKRNRRWLFASHWRNNSKIIIFNVYVLKLLDEG